jgi:Family of unknown function (DUF5996)
MTHAAWPALPYDAWKDTYETLHMWMQIVGKVRLACMPWQNHTWQVTLYPTASGLTTGRMPYGEDAFEIDFDFVAHELNVRTSRGEHGVIQLVPMSVAQFYAALMQALTALRIPMSIYPKPCEVESRLPFDEDDDHRSYDAEYANRCWRILCSSADVLVRFRSRYYGKASPVHFFWGSFDLAVTRFSGRVAPPHPGGIPNLPVRVARDAYSHEVSSAGFWPGGAPAPYPLFYSYAYPEPDGFADAKVQPSSARYDTTLREFILPYDDVRYADAPEQMLLAFLQSTYEAAADLGGWDRRSLEVPAETLHAALGTDR